MLEITNALDELENNLKKRNWWDEVSPDADKLNSCEPFCVDTLTFSQWLQWVYLPKMRLLPTLPQKSCLTPIAEEAWKGVENIDELLLLIKKLDELSEKLTREKR